MEVPPQVHFFPSTHPFAYRFVPENYVHWSQTPQSHLYSADIPGVRKEVIRVEVEDSRYLIITADRGFNRKFRLPEQVDVNGISAQYVAGVLTVTVPRRRFFIDPADRVHVLARAA